MTPKESRRLCLHRKLMFDTLIFNCFKFNFIASLTTVIITICYFY